MGRRKVATRQKRRPQPRAEKEPKQAQLPQSQQGKEVMALLLLFSGLFIYVTNHFPSTTGLIGYWLVDYALYNMIGSGIQYLPAFLISGAISLFWSKQRNITAALTGLTAAFIAFSIYLEFRINGPALLLQPPFETTGGGLIGVIGSYLLYQTVGTYGSLIVLLGTGLIAAVLVFNFSLQSGLELLGNFNRMILSLIEDNESQIASNTAYPWGLRMKKLAYMLFFKTKKPAAYSDEDLGKLRKIKRVALSRKRQAKDIATETYAETEQSTEPIRPKDHVPTLIHATEPKTITKTKSSEQGSDLDHYEFPPLRLLSTPSRRKRNRKEYEKDAQAKAAILEETLASFNVAAYVVNITAGPSVTRYELQPGEGVKISKITNLNQDIALKLAATNVRIEAPIPGKSLIGIEVPNSEVETVTLRAIIDQTNFMTNASKIVCAVGLTITGDPIAMDLGKMPHLLIAGATGSGKSVCINAIILSILLRARPDEVKFLMIDPKKVELSLYEGIPHLLAPVVTNPHLAAATLKQWAIAEMERRYEEFASAGVKDIAGYNAKVDELHDDWEKREKDREKQEKKAAKTAEQQPIQDSLTATPPSAMDENGDMPVQDLTEPYDPEPKKLPYIVVIIDELADLMMVASADVESTICRLAQMARATGIHLVVATQRPSVNVVTGLIKANIPSRISFAVQSQVDSRTILDTGGAEKLMGKGDMLYAPVGTLTPRRVQGVYASEDEVKKVVTFVKKQGGPSYSSELLEMKPETPSNDSSATDSGNEEQDLYEKAKEIVRSTQYASTSYLQRKLRIGYNRAARIMDDLEEEGVISAYDGDKKSRTVIG